MRVTSGIEITVCSILKSKGLGADVVFLIGFDQGRLPSKNTVEESEVYQFLVALTRTKKHMYLIHTAQKVVSSFKNSLGGCIQVI